jgi:hypothetical protein
VAKTEEHLKSTVALLKPRGVAITVFVPESLHGYLRNLAAEHERSLSGELRWVLKRYSEDPAAFDEH